MASLIHFCSSQTTVCFELPSNMCSYFALINFEYSLWSKSLHLLAGDFVLLDLEVHILMMKSKTVLCTQQVSDH